LGRAGRAGWAGGEQEHMYLPILDSDLWVQTEAPAVFAVKERKYVFMEQVWILLKILSLIANDGK
jgi:hypothetical protein